MFQGSASSVGKSLVCAGVCRILADMGYRVAPFKAQNMSLNSCPTENGEEISRAQWLQAKACRLVPDVRMNPVLLKPLGERGSEVIVMGESLGVMSYREYIDKKAGIWKTVIDAYRDLSRDMDYIALEGAGSPAEINLRKHDMANMGIARATGANVILIADIDKGGAFAALAGTMALLSRGDRAMIKGFILNKFRGDPALLQDALSWMGRRYKRPFLGIVPLLAGLKLPEEDSVAFKEKSLAPSGYYMEDGKTLDIAVPDFPSISNFTDLDPFMAESDVRIRILRDAGDFGRPDLVILPGSRNAGRDASFLRDTGLGRKIKEYAMGIAESARGALAGICGGMQIMGRVIEDPDGEETRGELAALDILPLATAMGRDKIVRTRRARFRADGLENYVHGYEIHRGRTRQLGNATVCVLGEDGEELGYADSRCPVGIWGTYLHGIFEDDLFRRDFLNTLRERKGLPRGDATVYDPDRQLDLLAKTLKNSIDITRLLAMGK
ncbi:MAG: cobyric acid synthase [Desulfovibrio sp.]|nr:cobyric acid synthase [Desulfovibrio sp.]